MIPWYLVQCLVQVLAEGRRQADCHLDVSEVYLMNWGLLYPQKRGTVVITSRMHI